MRSKRHLSTIIRIFLLAADTSCCFVSTDTIPIKKVGNHHLLLLGGVEGGRGVPDACRHKGRGGVPLEEGGGVGEEGRVDKRSLRRVVGKFWICSNWGRCVNLFIFWLLRRGKVKEGGEDWVQKGRIVRIFGAIVCN